MGVLVVPLSITAISQTSIRNLTFWLQHLTVTVLPVAELDIDFIGVKKIYQRKKSHAWVLNSRYGVKGRNFDHLTTRITLKPSLNLPFFLQISQGSTDTRQPKVAPPLILDDTDKIITIYKIYNNYHIIYYLSNF